MKYRAEIDGLRALAVIPVILYHAGFESVKGGYVGVDVFFVISGYLITTIIVNDLEKGQFSLAHFYERRVKRILPVLFLVVLVSIPLAWMYLPASEMKDFSNSLTAVSVFSSNIFFWSVSGYFDTATELKPLIHTWSLAVEEQYYILFPLILILFWRFGKKVILGLILVLFLSSLAAAQFVVFSKPSTAFYLLPTRGWEILLGAVCAFVLKKYKMPSTRIISVLSVIGVVLIIVAIVRFDKSTPTPSVYTLFPTLGTALVILFAQTDTFINRFLGLKPFVYCGLVSYSAYMWHQPLFAFYRKTEFAERQSSFHYIVLILITAVLAAFTWKFIETPVRRARIFSRKKLFITDFRARFNRHKI